jgi:Domain of unknown function (DUF4214)
MKDWGERLRVCAAEVGLHLVARYGRWSALSPQETITRARLTRAQVFDALLCSGEFARTVVPLIRLYFAYFGRPPDHDGLKYWMARSAAGQPLQAIAQRFAESSEFAARCRAFDDDGFVSHIFRAMYGRAVAARERRPWVEDLACGRTSRGEMVWAFSSSPDFHAHVADEVCSSVMYLFMLRRTPDPLGFAYWVESHRSGALAVDRMMRSDEYRGRWLASPAGKG